MSTGEDFDPPLDREVLGMSKEHFAEQAHLIQRGVRSLTLFSPFNENKIYQLLVAAMPETAAMGWSSIPFVLDRGDEICQCWFAAERRIIDSLE